MVEKRILALLNERERTYYELKGELKVHYGCLDYYLLKLKKKNRIKAVRKNGTVYYSIR
ncbi:MAG: hypothetical protein U9N35_05095 [Euryarchaeota archaeon]|nr:hypothetical protein [Euryarchaeota archaeon]